MLIRNDLPVDKLTPKPMVKWYDIKILFKTGIQLVLSNIFGTFADKRENFSHSDKPDEIDYSEGGKVKELWVDYIADLGDGFNSTYTMAYLLSKGFTSPKTKDKRELKLERGKVLIMGGDQVYPVASHDNYMQKLWLPYECAYPYDDQVHLKVDKESLPHVYAIPGNHDWYDGLNNFLKFFCQGRCMGGWQTKQKRSYFAMKMPHDWWIWGIDIQLGGDIDWLQLNYFQELAFNMMKDGDKVILCTAEPAWVYSNTVEGKKRFDKLNFFINNYIKKIVNENNDVRTLDLQVTISGDLHHYARYQHDFKLDGRDRTTHHITAGGGGAFMHPTHNLPPKLDIIPDILKPTVDRSLELKKSFPDKPTSKRMAWRNFLFPLHNRSLCLLLASVMLIIGLLTQRSSITWSTSGIVNYSIFNTIANQSYYNAFIGFFCKFIVSPASIILSLLFLFGLYTFRDNKNGNLWLNKGFGGLHALLHLFVGMATTVGLVQYFFIDYRLSPIIFYIYLGLLQLMLGWILHGEIFGAYLFIANRLLKCHDNEAFSHFAMADYKNMVKFHIREDGALDIYPIGVKKVCTDWNCNANPNNIYGQPMITPAGDKKIKYFLIESI